MIKELNDPLLCVNCDFPDLRRIELRAGLVYYCCDSCGHCDMDSRRRGMSEFFHEAQLRYYGEESILRETVPDLFEMEILRKRFSLLGRFLSVPSRVIEVGPGSGHVSKWLKLNSHEVTAVEHSPVLARQLSEMLSVAVMSGEFETVKLPMDKFDAFCSFHVIEHVSDPRMHLSKGLSVVRPGGLAFVATPNARSWQQMMFESISPNFDSAHFRVFSPASLVHLCQLSGWEVVTTTTPDYTAGWVRVLTKAIRRFRGEDEERTAGKYARSSSSMVRVAGRIFQFIFFPLRLLQSRFGYGNEIFLVLRKPDVS